MGTGRLRTASRLMPRQPPGYAALFIALAFRNLRRGGMASMNPSFTYEHPRLYLLIALPYEVFRVTHILFRVPRMNLLGYHVPTS
uniref:Uncharacterized protein n=1 Tax=Picea glauca TaxID=3330 RepID=A0A117NFZ2_PICGL|nr:hypothetical protein ABT39_MTgene2070 [Picea glauca]QHR87112.1 hypothetical protein Q903MT_gene1121 [Picea sitchensis]